MTKYVEILSAVDGFRRGGVAHPNVKTVHRVDAFSEVQLEQIKNEPRLSVRFFEVEEKKTEPEPAEKKQDENGKEAPKSDKSNGKKGK